MSFLQKLIVAALATASLTSGASFAASGTAMSLSEVEEMISKKQSTPQAVFDKLQEILKREPNNARAHFVAGELLEALGYRDLAQQEYAVSDKLDPTNPNSKLQLFTSKLENDDIEGARALMHYVKDRFPGDPSIQLMHGLLLIKEGKIEFAELVFTESLCSNKAVVGVATALGALRLKQQRWSEAVQLADIDLQRKPDHGSANLVKGEALLRSGRARESLIPLQKVFASTVYSKKPAADLLMVANKKLGRNADALEPALWSMTMSFNPLEMKQAKERVGRLINGLPESVVSNTIDAVDHDMAATTMQSRLHFALGDVFDSLGKAAQAEKEYKAGLAIEPTMGRGWYRLAQDRDKAGDYKTAFVYFNKAISFAPDDLQVQSAYSRFVGRTTIRQNDLAGRLRDLIRTR